jgi:homogentisate 1,2-dioxygenase
MMHEVVLRYASFDVVGWDGYNHHGFSIPMTHTGRVHQPPPVHQTFETSTFVVCSFVRTITIQNQFQPHTISNIDSDDIVLCVDGDFMSRNNKGHITLHQKEFLMTSAWSNGKKHRS